MDPQDAIDLGREAMKACFMVGGPILLASLAIGLLVGIVQAMTQVQDQTVSFVPKLLCMMLVLGLCLPWITDQMVDFSKQALSKPMTHYHTGQVSPASYFRTAGADDLSPNLTVSDTIVVPGDRSQKTESKQPFSLPSFRYSRLPKQNIDG